MSTGVPQGDGAAAAAGHAAQGRDAQDHLPAALVPSPAAAQGVPGHEGGGYRDPGTRWCIYDMLVRRFLLLVLTCLERGSRKWICAHPHKCTCASFLRLNTVVARLTNGLVVIYYWYSC